MRETSIQIVLFNLNFKCIRVIKLELCIKVLDHSITKEVRPSKNVCVLLRIGRNEEVERGIDSGGSQKCGELTGENPI